MITNYLTEFLAFVFGICIGSFLNVCIYRLPESKSIVHPRSMCPSCGTLIAFYDNIPIFSYIALRGKCRHCAARISFRYPVIEGISGIFAVGVLLKYGLSFEALIYYTFIATLLVITFIDIDHQIIPDVITLPGIPIFFVAGFALSQITVVQSLLGILVGGGSLFLVAWLYHLLTRKEGMGGGDIKLLAMMGAVIGWQGVLFTIFVASAVGTISGLLLMLKAGKSMKLAIPFGPFLAIGGTGDLAAHIQIVARFPRSAEGQGLDGQFGAHRVGHEAGYVDINPHHLAVEDVRVEPHLLAPMGEQGQVGEVLAVGIGRGGGGQRRVVAGDHGVDRRHHEQERNGGSCAQHGVRSSHGHRSPRAAR